MPFFTSIDNHKLEAERVFQLPSGSTVDSIAFYETVALLALFCRLYATRPDAATAFLPAND